MLKRYFIGTIKVPLSTFTYKADIGREENLVIIKELINVLRRRKGYEN